MTYLIDNNGRLLGSKQIEDLPYKNKNIIPRYCVIHYSAGNKLRSSINHLRKKGYSYHILIDRDGTVTQGAPIGKRASHAGYSNWHGTKWVNDFGIGICLNNLGYMDKQGSEFYNVNSHGEKRSPAFGKKDVVYASHWNKHNGSKKKGWEKFTEQQYQSLRDVINAIVNKFPDVVDAIGHEDIAAGRKPDPGPAFEWDRIHDLFPNRHSDIGSTKRVTVGPEDNLNLRSGPSRHWGVLEKLNDGTKLQVRANTYRYKSGKAYMSNWVSVAREGHKEHIGFVAGEFLK